MNQCIVYKKDGKIVNRAAVANFFAQIKDGKTMLASKNVDKRSLPQNNTFHMWLPMLVKGLRDAGFNEVKTVEDAKLICKSLFLKTVQRNEKTGVEVTVYKRTSDLTKEEFTQLLEDVAMWAASYLGITLPMPGEPVPMFDVAVAKYDYDLKTTIVE